MATQCSRELFGYEVVEGRAVVAAFDGGDNSSDAGGLLLWRDRVPGSAPPNESAGCCSNPSSSSGRSPVAPIRHHSNPSSTGRNS